MKKFLLRFFVLVLCSGFTGSVVGQVVHPDYFDGQVWVQFDKTMVIPHGEHGAVALENLRFLTAGDLSTYGITQVKKPFFFTKSADLQQVYEFHFSKSSKVYELIKKMEQWGFVLYAEQVPLMRTTLIPNDANYGQQYALPLIQAPAAWDITTGNSNIIVAVVDDAVKINHPDLAPSVIPGYDVADNDNDPMPNNNNMSHGTHVAGIIGAASNNGIGVASIGFGVSILPVKSSNQAQVITAGYAGIAWAADNGADVINLSWGGTGSSQSAQNVINYAYNAGCVIVAAAGNNNVNTQFYPAAYNNVISVASTSSSDAKSGFSNYGTWIDISAPGSAIHSTYFSSSNGANNYADLSGTSMASPMVAGLCGLMLSLNPGLNQVQLTNCLLSTATNINAQNPGYNGQLGAGRINAYQALLCVQSTVNAPPVGSIGLSSNLICPGNTVTFSGNSTGGLANNYSWTFPGGVPASSNQQNPTVTYNTPGSYQATLTVSNNFGSDVSTSSISVGYGGSTIVMAENFEASTQIPTGWTVSNPDNGITWVVNSVQGNLNSTRAAGINLYNYSNANGARDQLISPAFSLASVTSTELNFRHAHRRYSQSYADSLIIKVSTNNGATWVRVFADAENGSGNFATGSITNQNFVPATAADWCFGGNVGASCFTIDLSPFDGQANVKIMFESVNNYGNNMYIDDVEVSGLCSQPPGNPPVANFTSNSTTICAGSSIQYTDQSVNSPTSYSWTFPGGTPASSTQTNPTVVYNTAGIYSVTLVVTNPSGSDTKIMTNYVTVNPRPLNPSVANNNGVLTASPSGIGYQYEWYLNGSIIPGATQVTYTALVSGNYSVKITNEFGCSANSPLRNVQLNTGFDDIHSLVWKMFPNPATEWVNIEMTPADSDGWIKVKDMAGREVLMPTAYKTGQTLVTVTMTGMAAGLYGVEIIDAEGKVLGTGKLIKY